MDRCLYMYTHLILYKACPHTHALYLAEWNHHHHTRTLPQFTEKLGNLDTGIATYSTRGCYLGIWRAAESESKQIGRRNLARGTALPTDRSDRRHTGRATDTIHCHFTDATTLPCRIRRSDTVGTCLLRLHDRHGRGRDHIAALAILVFRVDICKTSQRPVILAERRRKLEKRDNNAEMNLHG
jgi:hypothetical protein